MGNLQGWYRCRIGAFVYPSLGYNPVSSMYCFVEKRWGFFSGRLLIDAQRPMFWAHTPLLFLVKNRFGRLLRDSKTCKTFQPESSIFFVKKEGRHKLFSKCLWVCHSAVSTLKTPRSLSGTWLLSTNLVKQEHGHSSGEVGVGLLLLHRVLLLCGCTLTSWVLLFISGKGRH